MFAGLIRGIAQSVAVLAGLLVTAGPAQAQLYERLLPITFTGVVSTSVADTIMIRQPNGTLVPYTGPVPAYPFDKGTPVSITFNGYVPTKEFYASPYYHGQVAADGIYRIGMSTTLLGGGPIGPNSAAMTFPSGGVGIGTNNLGQAPNASMTIVFDTNTNTYSLEGSGGFKSGFWAGPGFRYDSTTGQLIGCANGAECNNGAPGSFHIAGPGEAMFRQDGDSTGTQVSTGFIPILDDITNGFAGYFGVTMTGSWNLPQFGGGATQVPEPGMLGLFGGGVLLLAARRRRAAASR